MLLSRGKISKRWKQPFTNHFEIETKLYLVIVSNDGKTLGFLSIQNKVKI